MNPNLRHQVHYGTLQVHGNAAAMNSNLQYGNAQSATFFPSNMSNPKVYNQQASVMVNNQGFVAMNMDGFDAGQGQRIVGMQGTMAAQMQGAISMTANISPQFNNGGGGHSFNMTNGTMIPGSMMSTPGNMMQSSPGNILQASPNVMHTQNNIPVMQTSNNMVQGPTGNMMQFYKGMNPGMMNSPNGLPGMNFSPAQSSSVLPSFSQLFGTCSPGSQFQNTNQQQVHQGTVINPGNAGGFENFVQNVVVNTPTQHVQQLQQQHPLGQTFVNVYNQRQPVNTNAVNVNHFTCMPYKQGENVFMMTPTNLNNKFNSSMPLATVASHARPDCRFSGPGSGTNPGNIHVPISQSANIMDHSQTRQLVTQASTMVTTTVYSHANVTCSSVSSGPHNQCLVQRTSQSNCGHNHLTSDRAAHCALVSRPNSGSLCSTIAPSVPQCRTKVLDNSKQLMSSSTTVSLPSTYQDSSLSLVKCSSESEIVLPTTTASSTITSTTVSIEGPVCPKTSTITVPFGWRRVEEQGLIIYYSPSDTRLQSSECVRQYLQSDGTCKCGLECPLLVDEVFSFNAHVKSKAWEVTDVTCKTDLKKFCNHKRKTIAMATLKNSQTMQAASESTEKNNNEPSNSTTVSATTSSQAVKKEGKKKKKGNKNKSGSGPYDGVLVSQLLAQRDKTRTSVGRNSLHVPLSKELSSLIDAALGNKDSSSKKQSTDDTHKKDSHVDAKVEPDVHKTPLTGEKNLTVSASKQTNPCSNVLKFVEKRDPMDDLGPITCHVPGKLDFSLGRPMSNCQHMFNRSPMLSPGLPNNSCLTPNPSHNNPLSIQTSFGQDAYKNQRIFLQSPPCNTGPNTPCDVPMQMPGYAISDQMAQGYNVDHGGIMIPEQMMNMQSPVRFPAAFNQNQQTVNPYHCGPLQHPYMPLSSIRNNLSAPWLEQRTKPKRPRSKAKKKERKKIGERSSPCPNIDVRSMHVPSDAGAGGGNTPAPMASFLDNPTAFLAQQTALVHNSMASTSQGLHSAPGGIVDCINKNILSSQALSNKGSIESNPADENKKPILNHKQNTFFSQPEPGSLLTCKSEPHDTSPVSSFSTSSTVTCTTHSNSQSDPEDKKPPVSKEENVTTAVPKEEPMLGTEAMSDQQAKDKSELSESSCNTNYGREQGPNIKTNPFSEDHVQKTETISGEKRKTSSHHKTKEAKNLKHTLRKPSGNFPASTLLSAAARAQLASQIQSHVNNKVYIKTNSTSPCSRLSTPSGCMVNTSSKSDPEGSASVHSYQKNRFDGQKLNVSQNNKMTSSPLITQCCLEDNPSKTLNGYNNFYGGMNPALSHLSSDFSKEQSPIQMVQNVVASIDGKSEMFKANLLNTGLSFMPDSSNPKQKDANPLFQELSMDMGKSAGTLQDPAYKASLQQLVNQALLQQGLNNMNSLPLGGHMPLLGVNSGLPPGPMSGLAPITPNNNLSQLIPAMGLTQPVIAQQPLLQLISTLNLNTNNPMLLTSPSLNSPNQTPIAGNMPTPQMMGVSISRAQVPNTDGTYGIDSLAQTSAPVQVNQTDSQFDQNYPAMDIKTADDLKTSTGTLIDGINQNPATCPAQLVLLPQLQMPMVQMMGPNQMQINSNCMEKNNINNINLNLNMTQMVVPGQAASPQNLGMFSPNLANNNLNLFNLQQMMNLCSATNVTTAQLQQLQCLQLQQQLLQQYMQTLINQLGVQGTVNNSVPHPEKQESENSEAITQHGTNTNSGEKNIVNSLKETQNSSDKCPDQEEESEANMNQDDNASTCEGTYEPESGNGVKLSCSDDNSTEENQTADIKSESLDDNCESQQRSGETNDNEMSCIHGSNKTEENSESAPVSCDLEKDDLSACEHNEISVSPNSNNTAAEDVETSKSLADNVDIGETVSAISSVDSNHIDHSYEDMVVDSIPGTEGSEAGSSQTESVTKSFPDTDSSTNHACEDYNFPDVPSNETDSLTGDQGLEVCDGPTTGDQLMVMANGPPTDQHYRHEDTSSLDGLSSSEDEKIDEIFANHRGLKRVLRDNRDSILDDEDSLDFDDKAIVGVFPRNFNVGDLVWGQIRGFPSWPGKLVHENQVKGTPKTEDGKLWVKWFGDHTCTQVEPDKLKTLSEGLEAHHRARKKYRKGRKMNSHLESAIQEAMNELDRPTENVEPVSQTNRYVKGRPVKKRRTR